MSTPIAGETLRISNESIMSEKSRVVKQSKKLNASLRYHYPWVSMVAALALIAYLVVLKHPQLIEPYQLIKTVRSDVFYWTMIGLFIYILLSDVIFFTRQLKKNRQLLERLNAEIDDLWESKKKVQQRAHVYSGHADKLKLFISEKLLEYIEYDEKFLHFKSIAAEVRHNGVISYDKIKSALHHSIKQLDTPSTVSNFETSEHSDSEPQPNARMEIEQSREIYSEALAAMQYLWDLLDLSTADNIALHIANHLITCEEYYYQNELNKQNEFSRQSAIPITPSFDPVAATLTAMSGFLERESLNSLRQQCLMSDESRVVIELEQFRFRFDSVEPLLGNPNHWVLLLENLIKNSLFFFDKRKNKQTSDKVGLQLVQHQGFVELSVYNRGSTISQENKDKLFQLGYTTRREKEHHGKGLGLFFVNEIVKGYEGRIDVHNVGNPGQTLTLRMLTSNDMVITKLIHIVEDDGFPMVAESDEGSTELVLHEKLSWEYAVPIVDVEISVTSHSETHRFESLDAKTDHSFLDVFSPNIPGWLLRVNNHRKAFRVEFVALDRTGVVFSIKLPDVNARLEDSNPLADNNFEGEVEKLEQQFKAFE